MKPTPFDPIYSAAEQQYSLPPGLLRAQGWVESRFNPKAVSPKGAQGIAQLMPDTAKQFGVDPFDPKQAIFTQAKIMAQNLKASGGDIDRATMMYNGGPRFNPRNPETAAYPAKIAAALGPAPTAQPQPRGGDPIEAALSGQPVTPQAAAPQDAPPAAAPDPNDPIEGALAGGVQDRTAEIASAQAEASKRLAAGDEKGAIDILAQHNLQMAPGELDAFHAGKRRPGFNHLDQLPDQAPQGGQTDQGLGFYAGLTKPIDNAALWLKEGADNLGIGSTIDAIGQKMGLPSVEQANAAHQSFIKGQEAQGSTPGKVGEFAGSVAGTLPVMLATKNPWLAGSISGALETDNPNDLKQTAKDAAFGAVGGKVADVLTGAASGVLAPKVSAAVQKLHDLGVQLTPGQIIGGALKRMEDGATSIPFLGDLVKNAQRRSSVSLNAGVINDRVLGPIGKALPKGMAGREAVDFADNAVSNAYDALLPKLTVQADKPLVQNVGQILQTLHELPPDRAAQVQQIVNKSFLSRFNQPGLNMTGDTFKEADSKLGQLAREYSGSADPEQRKMGSIFRDVQGEFRSLLERANPQYAPQLKSINQAFANLVRVEGAAASAGAKGGVFTPNQLAAAVKRFDTSPRKKAYATGKALLQDVSDPASEVLPQSVPDSGTPYRTLGAYLLGGGIGHASPWAAPLVAPFGLYSKVGQQAFQKAVLAPRGAGAKALAKALTKMKAPLAVAGGAAGAETSHAF